MSSMPTLATGAGQDPYACGSAGQTRTLLLADGSEQRYLARAQRKSWSVELRLLSDAERQQMLDFAQNAVRTQASFSFTDPANGVVYPTCRMAIAPITDRIDGVARTALGFVIAEVAA